MIQWGEHISNGDNITTTSFPVKFSTNAKILVSGYPNNTTITSEISTDNILIFDKSLSFFRIKWHNHDTNWSVVWLAIGC